MNCQRKHTKVQIPDEDWKCPKCSKGVGYFCVDDFGEDECSLLHNDDLLRCYECGHEVSAQTFVRNHVKKQELVKCPCCKGSGMVKKGDEKSEQ